MGKNKKLENRETTLTDVCAEGELDYMIRFFDNDMKRYGYIFTIGFRFNKDECQKSKRRCENKTRGLRSRAL